MVRHLLTALLAVTFVATAASDVEARPKRAKSSKKVRTKTNDGPKPIDLADRKALLALHATLPLHGVVPFAPPELDASDATFRRFGRKLLDVFAPARWSGKRKNRAAARNRPLARELEALVPTHHRYVALQAKLLLVAKGIEHNQPIIKKPAYKVRVGTTSREVGQLRDRLLMEGLGSPNVKGRLRNYFDKRLKWAMWKWQKKNGLPKTVILDHTTRRRLNKPIPPRVNHLALALKRWRDIGLRGDAGRHILVHLNDFELEAIEEGRTVLDMRVVIGKATEADATPALSALVERVVVNPAWIVPERIVGELRDRLGDSPDALREAGYEVTLKDADGRVDDGVNAVEGPPLDPKTAQWRVRRPPGDDNPLGKVKFALTHTDGIYLHDTTSRAPFARDVRTESHGCVRVESPEALTHWLLPEDKQLIADKLAGTAMATMRPVNVNAHLVYQTITLDPEGKVVRHADVYNRDAAELAAIDNNALVEAVAGHGTQDESLNKR